MSFTQVLEESKANRMLFYGTRPGAVSNMHGVEYFASRAIPISMKYTARGSASTRCGWVGEQKR